MKNINKSRALVTLCRCLLLLTFAFSCTKLSAASRGAAQEATRSQQEQALLLPQPMFSAKKFFQNAWEVPAGFFQPRFHYIKFFTFLFLTLFSCCSYNTTIFGVGSFFFVLFLECLVYLVLNQFSYPEVFDSNPSVKKQFVTRVLSTLHSTIIAFAALSALYYYGFFGHIFGTSPLSNNQLRAALTFLNRATVITRAYLLWDSIYIIFYAPYGIKKKIPYLLHHLIFLGSIILPGTKDIELLLLGLLSEFTNLFLNLSWYCIKIGQEENLFFKTNGLLGLLTYFFSRIVNFTYIFWRLIRDGSSYHWKATMFTPLLLLNYFWFGLMIKKVTDAFSPPKVSKKRERA